MKDGYQQKYETIFSEADRLRKKALQTVDTTTASRQKQGWVWITDKHKTEKQVHPNKLEGYLLEGWKLTKKSNE